jgi:hypothetical protein
MRKDNDVLSSFYFIIPPNPIFLPIKSPIYLPISSTFVPPRCNRDVRDPLEQISWTLNLLPYLYLLLSLVHLYRLGAYMIVLHLTNSSSSGPVCQSSILSSSQSLHVEENTACPEGIHTYDTGIQDFYQDLTILQ